jgi:hypothetical protein
MSKWTHSICEADWIDKLGNWETLPDGNEALMSIPAPTRLKDAQLEQCCYCGRPTIFGAYIREDPNVLPCKGEGHE